MTQNIFNNEALLEALNRDEKKTTEDLTIGKTSGSAVTDFRARIMEST